MSSKNVEPLRIQFIDWRRLNVAFRESYTHVKFGVKTSDSRKREYTDVLARTSEGRAQKDHMMFVANPAEDCAVEFSCTIVRQKKEIVIGTWQILLSTLRPYNDVHDMVLKLRASEGMDAEGESGQPLYDNEIVCEFHVLATAFARRSKNDLKLSPTLQANPKELFQLLEKKDLFQLVLAQKGGVNANVRDSKTLDTPLHLVVAMKQAVFAEVLLDIPGIDPGQKNVDGNTPLHLFCKSFSSDDKACTLLLNKFLARGASLTELNEAGETPLHRAVLNTRVSVILARLLLARPEVDVNAQTGRGLTPLHYAVQTRNPALVHVLVEHGADMNIKDNYGDRPVDVACKINDTTTATLLADFHDTDVILNSLGLADKRLVFMSKRWFREILPHLEDRELKEAKIDPSRFAELRVRFAELGKQPRVSINADTLTPVASPQPAEEEFMNVDPNFDPAKSGFVVSPSPSNSSNSSSPYNAPKNPQNPNYNPDLKLPEDLTTTSSPYFQRWQSPTSSDSSPSLNVSSKTLSESQSLTIEMAAKKLNNPSPKSSPKSPDHHHAHASPSPADMFPVPPIGTPLENAGPLNVRVIDETQVKLDKELGRGSAGVVYRATFENKTVAVKIVTNDGLDTEKSAEIFMKECRVNASVRSPYIVELFGVIWGNRVLPNKMAMVMELCECGSLFDVLNRTTDITWSNAFSYMMQATKGLLALHTHRPPILHRDFKSLNILVSPDPANPHDLRLKICDFGLSRTDVSSNFRTLNKLRGTYTYSAPEVVMGKQYTEKSDVYSLAIIFWEIVTRVLCRQYVRPYNEFSEKMEYLIFQKVGKEGLRPTFPPTTPSTIENMIKLCWNQDPLARPPCETIISTLEMLQLDYGSDHANFDSCIVRKTK